jgi:hypothetical protein
MLGDYPINVVLLAKDLDSAKDFYANKVKDGADEPQSSCRFVGVSRGSPRRRAEP